MIFVSAYNDTDTAGKVSTASMLPGPDNDPLNAPSKNKKTGIPRNMLAAIGAVVVMIVAIAVLLIVRMPSNATTTTITATTSMATTTVQTQLASYQIFGCTMINKPGVYNVTDNIITTNTTAPCITIDSNNVVLQGLGHSITGSGPFVESGTPSYGVFVRDVSGVKIEGLDISRFSYDVYLSGVSNSSVTNVNAVNGTMSDAYLTGSSEIKLSNDTIYSSLSNNGGLFIEGGKNNTVNNSRIMYNAYYGLDLNSTGNKFYNNSFSNNPVDLECAGNATYNSTNVFKSSECQVNQYCNFASCTSRNIPYNISNTQLSTAINGCGSVNNNGVYTLSGNISMTDYENTSNPLSRKDACITINSPDVKLNCQGKTISNAYYGIVVSGLYNTSVVNCNFENDMYGLFDKNTIGTVINNVSSRDTTYGIYLNDTTGSVVQNATARADVFGLYLNASSGASLYGLNMTGNSYGIYVNGQEGNSYYSGKSLNNTKGDLYCSATAYNSTQNLFHPLLCSSSDCSWATSSCSKILSLPLPVTSLNACGSISTPGNYKLSGDLIGGSGTCIAINSDNVTLNCEGNSINGAGSGTAVSVKGSDGVNLNDCGIKNFDYAINLDNSTYVNITGSNISNVKYGVYEKGGHYGTINDNKITIFSSSAISLNATNNTIIENNSASSGSLDTVAYVFSGIFNSIILDNSAQNNGAYAFSLTKSRNNKILNNSETGNGPAGYYCDAYSSGLYAQQNNVNYGNGKLGCVWMIEINRQVPQTCSAVMSSSTVELSQDMLYTYGGTCFSVINQNGQNANNTLINCNGHTVLATNGGTFVNVSKASGVQLENCYLKGFTIGINSNGADTVVVNNTITNTKTAVNIENAEYNNVRHNTITNSSYGISISNAKYGSVKNNFIMNVNISMQLNGLFDENINNNTARIGNIGLYLFNATQNFFQDNILTNQSNSGIICDKTSGNTSSINRDYGNNVCSSNIACDWMTSSPLCKV